MGREERRVNSCFSTAALATSVKYISTSRFRSRMWETSRRNGAEESDTSRGYEGLALTPRGRPVEISHFINLGGLTPIESPLAAAFKSNIFRRDTCVFTAWPVILFQVMKILMLAFLGLSLSAAQEQPTTETDKAAITVR